MNYDSMLDFIEIMAGAYLIYLAVKMKQSGDVSNNGLISKGLDLNKAPDPMSYITVMFPWSMIMGTILIVCGVVSRMLATSEYYRLVVTISMFVAAFAIVIYSYVSIRSQKKYLMPPDAQGLGRFGKKK